MGSKAKSTTKPRSKSSSTAENRKLQNRLSQQAYRARQVSELNELRKRLMQYENSESHRNTKLVTENRELRYRLWECQKKLRSLQAKLTGIADSLTIDGDAGQPDFQNPVDSVAATDTGQIRESKGPGSPSTSDIPSSGQALAAPDLDMDSNTWSDGGLDAFVLSDNDSVDTGNDHSQLPLPLLGSVEPGPGAKSTRRVSVSNENIVFPINDSLPPDPLEKQSDVGTDSVGLDYLLLNPASSNNCLQSMTCQENYVNSVPSLKISYTPPTLFDHIKAYESSLVMCLGSQAQTLDLNSLTRTIEKIISAFVCLAWPCMQTWFTYTNGYHAIARLTAWRLFPSQSTLEGLPAFFKPSPTQICVEHPPVIDWVIFPFLRDKLIEFHSNDPNLSQICRDLIRNYVVQAELSELVDGAESMTVNISVWDVMMALNNADQGSNLGLTTCGRRVSEVKLPAPRLRDLFHDGRYARLLYQHLSLDQGSNISLDPSFFSTYPHLYEADDCMAVGFPIRSSNLTVFPIAPRPVDVVTTRIYRNLASCTKSITLLEGVAIADDSGLGSNFQV